MTTYRLSKDAEDDLHDIARYTLATWGLEISEQYRDGLRETFEGIGRGAITTKQFSPRLPGISVAKYRHHYIFHINDDQIGMPTIIGVIHEKRDVVRHLKGRID